MPARKSYYPARIVGMLVISGNRDYVFGDISLGFFADIMDLLIHMSANMNACVTIPSLYLKAPADPSFIYSTAALLLTATM